MASLTNIIQQLIKEGKLPEDASGNNLTNEQWEIVGEAMRQAQNEAFESGFRTGMRPGLTPEEQAKRDRENPNLKDPIRDGSEERKG